MSRKSVAAYSVSSHLGEAFSETEGSAISKALTHASRIQRQMVDGDEPCSVYVRNPLDNVVARVDVTKPLIEVRVLRRNNTRAPGLRDSRGFEELASGGRRR